MTPLSKPDTPLVLVAPLRCYSDRNILIEKLWYRIPLKKAPKRKPSYIAFYQTASFGKSGKRISLYGKIKFWRIKKRIEILPEEKDHPRAKEPYIQFFFHRVKKLARPVKNSARMRIVFGFTTLRNLRKSGDTRNLFEIPPIEDILAKELQKSKIPFTRQKYISAGGRRFFMDFAIKRRRVLLNVECDGFKWHSRSSQRRKDAERDRLISASGWKILRLGEKEILENTKEAIDKIRLALGG